MLQYISIRAHRFGTGIPYVGPRYCRKVRFVVHSGLVEARKPGPKETHVGQAKKNREMNAKRAAAGLPPVPVNAPRWVLYAPRGEGETCAAFFSDPSDRMNWPMSKLRALSRRATAGDSDAAATLFDYYSDNHYPTVQGVLPAHAAGRDVVAEYTDHGGPDDASFCMHFPPRLNSDGVCECPVCTCSLALAMREGRVSEFATDVTPWEDE